MNEDADQFVLVQASGKMYFILAHLVLLTSKMKKNQMVSPSISSKTSLTLASFRRLSARTLNPLLFLPQRAYDLKNNQFTFLFLNSKPDLNYNKMYCNLQRLHFAIAHLLGGMQPSTEGMAVTL